MENVEFNKYFGGTGITLDKIKEAIPTINVDGTTYPIERWLKECEVFDKLVPNKSKVWIPYSGTLDFGVLTEVVWNKTYLNGNPKYRNTFDEDDDLNLNPKTDDWWVAEPFCKVSHTNGEFYVYEISFYKNWKRKTQMNHLFAQKEKPKRKFLSQKDIADLKKQEAISNRTK